MFKALLIAQEHLNQSITSLQGQHNKYYTDIPEETDDIINNEQYEVEYILNSRMHDGVL